MFPLGHAGISLALAVSLTLVLKKEWEPKTFLMAVAVGAWLPDIIDKPVGLLLGYPGGGRLAAHSLLFAVIFTLLTLSINRFARTESGRWNTLASYVPFVAFGSWMHLVLDQMWRNPQVFLWPGYGWGLPYGGEFDPISILLSPVVLAGEILGGVILVGFVVWYFRLRRSGKLWESST